MRLTEEILKDIADQVNSPHKKQLRREDYKRFLMFHGATEDIIRQAISCEFKKPETVEELMSRLIPINFVNKIVTKLSGVYTESPIRRVRDRSVSDQELLDLYVDKMCLNQRMKEANRYFKLFKRNLMETYVDEFGTPHVRNLPRHTYEVFSFSALTPNRPDVVVKILRDDEIADKRILAVWSDESHYVINGKGHVDTESMLRIQNLTGDNVYGALPFIYINESSYSVDPIADDDLIRLAIAIPVILTDICFATKYQSWSLIYTVGDVGDIPMNPNSVLPMNWGPDGQKPEIGQIKPEVDTDKVLSMVQTLVALLLSTKSLSVNTFQAKLEATTAASGISKMLDNAESVEDKKDQQEYFLRAEKDFWKMLKEKLIPIWRFNQKLAPDLNRMFSDAFDMDVYFKEPKVMISEMDQIEISRARLDAGFSTLSMELKNIYPQLDEAQIEELAIEIDQEKATKQQSMANQIDGIATDQTAA